MLNNITPKRPAAYIPVRIYLSATPHGFNGQAYLSGLAWLSILDSSPKKKSQRHRGHVLKDELNINTRPSIYQMQERPQKLVFWSHSKLNMNPQILFLIMDLVCRGIKGDSKRVATK